MGDCLEGLVIGCLSSILKSTILFALHLDHYFYEFLQKKNSYLFILVICIFTVLVWFCSVKYNLRPYMSVVYYPFLCCLRHLLIHVVIASLLSFMLSCFQVNMLIHCRVLICQTLDNGLNIIQLETAVGAGIKSFEGAVGTLNSLCDNI